MYPKARAKSNAYHHHTQDSTITTLKTPPTSPPPPKLSPYNQKALSILHQDSPVFLITKGPSCSYLQEYEQEFPALTTFKHLDSRTKQDWKIKNPTTIGPTRQANTISPAKATLNWQSENAVAQNKVLVKILSQQDVVIKRFLTRLQGHLRDWYHSLGEYRQLQIQQSISPEAFMSIIYLEFIGSLRNHTSITGLNQVEPVDVSDLESLYSLDDEPSDLGLCVIAYLEFSSDDDSDTDSLESDSDFGVHMINPLPHILPIQEDPPLPLAKVHLHMDAYAKPILVIAFFDTGSSVSILNLNILPDHYWKRHHQNFMATNGEKSFPLPQEEIPCFSTVDARIPSKIDLKSGFWQLGIKPEDRPKTAFCIPDHHYQWKVMPFGLKNAPSAFQKAMITIFEPILGQKQRLTNCLDSPVFPRRTSHAEYIKGSIPLVAKYGIMLSEKKMEVGVTTIQFLGMEISDRKYQPQLHVAQELLKFPNELSSQKMIQQFLGLESL
ncbi:putative zinc finger, CCHC-type containing protein [Tanacetum coccineum]|uniref:Zinc finger, CCHC-type containing protein n=1 Tax=Tanacetum coccineum TaxID=301880 RepID=A0ABQ4ZTR3_9ASTR